MADKNISININPSLPVLLGIAFIVLKLCHVIDWSWLWVTCPLWAGLAIVLIITFGGLVIAALASILVIINRITSKLIVSVGRLVQKSVERKRL